MQSFEVAIPGVDGRSVARVVKIQVPVEWDEDASDWVLRPSALELIDETMRQYRVR